MTKREKVDLSQQILDTAAELFYREGVRSVGVDRIAAESGVAKMTLYYHFRSKDELVAAWLRRRDDEWMSWLASAVERRRGSRLLAVFEALREWFETPTFRGCAFVNAYGELGSSNPAAAEIVASHKRTLNEYLADLARQEGAAEPTPTPSRESSSCSSTGRSSPHRSRATRGPRTTPAGRRRR